VQAWKDVVFAVLHGMTMDTLVMQLPSPCSAAAIVHAAEGVHCNLVVHSLYVARRQLEV
jgi:hypothetical protein